MNSDEIIDFLSQRDGILVLRPGPGDGSPQIAWGDTFFYYAPDGQVPKTQPFATIVTKNYPGDEESQLDRPDALRVNIFAGKDTFTQWIGRRPRDPADDVDFSATDTVIPHPVYDTLGWLAVVNPGPHTTATVRELLESAYQLAVARTHRRDGLARMVIEDEEAGSYEHTASPRPTRYQRRS